MKRVTAIVRPEKMEPLKDALFAADVKGMTISQVHGCGAQHGWSEYVRGTEVMLNMVPKVKFEVVVEDDAVDALVDTIVGAARTGQFTGGCDGNLKAISKLVAGQNVDDIVAMMEGHTCGRRSTSCVDQMTKAIREAQAKAAEEA